MEMGSDGKIKWIVCKELRKMEKRRRNNLVRCGGISVQ